MAEQRWAGQIYRLDTVDSTNRYARELARQGAPHGTVVLAQQQTGGRGRLGRSFSSPRGLGIYCSVVLHYEISPEELFLLTPLMAETARSAVVRATGLEPQIKWINDLVLNGRKLCGILTELGTSGSRVDYVIVGIGLNCGQQEEDFPPELRQTAISLTQALGRPVDRAAVEQELLACVQAAAEAFPHDVDDWMARYRANCVTLGQDVQLIRGDEMRRAHVDDMDDRGALLVTLPDGTKETVFSGEVSVRGLYGYTDMNGGSGHG